MFGLDSCNYQCCLNKEAGQNYINFNLFWLRGKWRILGDKLSKPTGKHMLVFFYLHHGYHHIGEEIKLKEFYKSFDLWKGMTFSLTELNNNVISE